MTLTLDKMNRVVVPKALRNRFSLGPGDELEVRVDREGIHLCPAVPPAALVDCDGLLVCQSEVPQEAWDLSVLMNNERERRGRELAGLG